MIYCCRLLLSHPLNGKRSSSRENNSLAFDLYRKEINLYTQIREYLIEFLLDLPVIGSRSIHLQASSLAFLTAATDQLTRVTSVIFTFTTNTLALYVHIDESGC